MAGDYQYVAGPFTATWNGNSIGQSISGFTLEFNQLHQPLMVDEFGRSEINGVIMGVNVMCHVDGAEFLKLQTACAAQFGTVAADAMTIDPSTKIGKLLSDYAAALVLTPVVRTNNGKKWTFYSTIIVDDFSFVLGSSLREIPVTFKCMPNPTNVPTNSLGKIGISESV